jgi:peptide chain release factor 1
MNKKIQELLQRLEKVEGLLELPTTISDQKIYKELMQEHSYLAEVREIWSEINKKNRLLKENDLILKNETDIEFVQLLKEENRGLQDSIQKFTAKLKNLLVPPDPLDSRSIIMEVRAGTGGDEAALFVGDCIRMYKAYADKKRWECETISSSPSERGGFREYIMVFSGLNVFRELQHEAGTHRVQRVPETEAQGRLHTSAVTVAILPEPSDEEKLTIKEKDLRIETTRSSGAGGQHVNTTDSAVRIVHIPSGLVAACQDERSQHKNKAKALRLLEAKIVEEKRRQDNEKLSSLRLSQVGSGDRSERIRTYNFPQNRLTDHRINFTAHNLTEVLNGKLEELINELINFFYQEKAGDIEFL